MGRTSSSVTARFAGTLLLAVAGLLLGAPSSRAAVHCEEFAGPPTELTTAVIEIVDPPGSLTVSPTAPCSQELTLTGTWEVTGPAVYYDIYIVIDASGSTGGDSGADADGDGRFGGPGDTIYQAEITAALNFTSGLDLNYARLAVIRFSSTATITQPLTANLLQANAGLAAMRSVPPGGGTGYVNAMRAVEQEYATNGDPAREQLILFLSDGQPSDGIAAVQAEASNIAALGMVMDTFALGFTTSFALEEMARICNGVFTALAVPGDIIALLPDFVPDLPYTFDSRNDLTGGAFDVDERRSDGTFTVVVTLTPGVNHIVLTLDVGGPHPVVVECSIDVTMPATLFADAGPDQLACGGTRVLLDGSATQHSTCIATTYQWFDCLGAEVCAPSTSPTCEIEACAGCTTYTLVVGCLGQGCTSRSDVDVTCGVAPPLAPIWRACSLTAEFACGGNPSLDDFWDVDAGVDSDSDGDPRNDADVTGCHAYHAFGAAGDHDVVAWSIDPASGCASSQDLTVTVEEPIARAVGGGICPLTMVDFSCGTAEPGYEYWWDFDGSLDSDGDTDPTNDADATGCDVQNSWSSSGLVAISGWQRDMDGCVVMIAVGLMDVSTVALPPEADGLLVSRAGPSVSMDWNPVAGAVTYRVARGTIGSLRYGRAYDHSADANVGMGTCDTSGATSFDDVDDASEPGSFYYLVTAVNDCDLEGSPGFGWDRHVYFPRDARIPSPSCP